MESMILHAISLGLTHYCITDHMDRNYPDQPGSFEFDLAAYQKSVEEMQMKYKNQIKIIFGIELGLRNEPDIKHEMKLFYDALLSEYRFDFVIGSTHVLEFMDPYYDSYWKNKTVKQGIINYFQSISENVSYYHNFQIYGHLDYIVRYLPQDTKEYSYSNYTDIIDHLLKVLIDEGIGIELNTAGFRYGLNSPHPKAEILKRYKELGGEILTIGSDAHRPEHIAYDFSKAEELLISLGYNYYAVFEERKPLFIKL